MPYIIRTSPIRTCFSHSCHKSLPDRLLLLCSLQRRARRRVKPQIERRAIRRGQYFRTLLLTSLMSTSPVCFCIFSLHHHIASSYFPALAQPELAARGLTWLSKLADQARAGNCKVKIYKEDKTQHAKAASCYRSCKPGYIGYKTSASKACVLPQYQKLSSKDISCSEVMMQVLSLHVPLSSISQHALTFPCSSSSSHRPWRVTLGSTPSQVSLKKWSVNFL